MYLLVIIASITAAARIMENKLPGNTALPSSKKDLEKLALLAKGNYKHQVANYYAKPKASLVTKN
jgi:hypothetical protein